MVLVTRSGMRARRVGGVATGLVVALVAGALAGVAVPAAQASGHARLVSGNDKLVWSDTDSGHLWMSDPDGANAVDLSHGWAGRYQAGNPKLSPDGRTIVFMMRDLNRTTFGIDELYTMPAAPTPVSGLTRLTKNEVDDDTPNWSPDGKKIVFTRALDSNTHFGNSELFTMKRDGSAVTRLTTQWAYNLDPAYSTDGTKIAYASTVDKIRCHLSPTSYAELLQIEVMPAGGGTPTNVTHNNHVTAVAPDWSPDGTTLAYNERGLSAAPDCSYGENELIVNRLSDGTAGTDIAQGAAPQWSPDGSRIAAIDAGYRLFTVDPNGTNVTYLNRYGNLGDWAVAATPRTATTTTLTVTKRAKLKAAGSVSPNLAGEKVTVTLLRKRSGSFVKLAASTVTLSSSSTYAAAFTRPASGTCRVKAAYAGDATHAPSSRSVTTGC